MWAALLRRAAPTARPVVAIAQGTGQSAGRAPWYHAFWIIRLRASTRVAGSVSEEKPMAGINMNQLMKQAQQMQQKLAEAQESMNEVTVDASAGGGMVKVTVDGAMQLKSVTIDPDALDPEDVEMLQDMIVAAVNEACRGVAEIANKRMSAVTGGMGAGIPGMPF